jgi:pSer/pThr/pTyr-binding forkhead associated (FHA) protein
MKLVFPAGEHAQVLLNSGINRVGSDPQSTVVLDRPGVQPQHCELHVGNNRVMLQVPPGGAVSVNGRAVDGLIALRLGDCIGIDGIQARLASVGAVPQPASGDSRPLPAAANEDSGMTTVRPALPRYVLRCVSGAGLGRSYPLLGATTVGRAVECALQVEAPGLSRQHARLMPLEDGVRVEDLGSTNGTFVNDHRIDSALARSGDEIGFDNVRFRLLDSTRSELQQVAGRPAPPRFRMPLWWWVGVLAVAAVVAWVVLALR